MIHNNTKVAKIPLYTLAMRGRPDYSQVADEEFPIEIGSESGEPDNDGNLRAARIAELRVQLVKPVPPALCKMGRSTRAFKGEQANAAKVRGEFYASRILLKVKRMRNPSNLPDNYNPNEIRVNGVRYEFPNDRWCASPPAVIEVLQDAHSELKVNMENREPPKDIPKGSDIAFPGLQVEYWELKNYNVMIAIPSSAYLKRKAVA